MTRLETFDQSDEDNQQKDKDKTFREHTHRMIVETCDPCNLWHLVKNYDISHSTNIQSDPSIKSERGQHSQFLW